MPSLHLETANEKRILIVDAGSILYPAYHVMKNFSTRAGFPTGAIYGFTRTLFNLPREYPSRYMAVAFDAPGEKLRHKRYAEYKAHRPKMDDALAVQVPWTKELIDAFGIARFEEPGYEADDLIATLVEHARKHDLEVLIVSGDKDLMQLVDDRVKVLKPSRDPGKDLTPMGAREVEQYLGVSPDKIRDYLALTGDSTDNVPGVPGIGEVTARKLLQEFHTFEKVLENAGKVGNARVRQALLEHKDQAQLSYELVRLETVSLDDPIQRCRVAEPDWLRVQQILEELEFQSMLKELDLLSATTPKPTEKVDYHIVTSEEALDELCKRLASANEISLDLETTSQDDMKAEIVGIAIALEPHKGYYIPVGHEGLGVPRQLKLAAVLSKLRTFLESDRVEIIGQNLKYDAKVLARAGVNLRKIAFDTMLAGYLLDPESRKDLHELALRYLGHGMKSFSELSQKQMSAVPMEEAAEYAVGDAAAVIRLKTVLLPKLKELKLEKLFYEVELPLIPVLVAMELKGILVDQDVLREQGKSLEVLLDQLKREIFQLAGEEFNPNSPRQVASILFEKLNLPVRRKTKTGPSTDALVLEELSAMHPLPEKLLAYRELEKLLNTYVRKLPEHIHPQTGRIHTSFHQSVTTTGRLSSSDPNLQNIPIRSQLGGQIREAFIAPRGRSLIGADYSQIELRIMAHIAGDRGLMEAFERDEDIHARTAATMFSVPLEKVNTQQRDIAKRINFGIAYGMSSFGLAQWAKIPRKDADQFIQSYFASYPGVKAYMESIIKQAGEQGYVETLLGRRRYFAKLDSRSEREAINMPIQGSAADLMKLAMIRLHEQIQAGKLKADMLLQIHDELIFEVDKDQAEESAKLIKETMEGVMQLAVPLKVDVKIGQNWGEI